VGRVGPGKVKVLEVPRRGPVLKKQPERRRRGTKKSLLKSKKIVLDLFTRGGEKRQVAQISKQPNRHGKMETLKCMNWQGKHLLKV